MNSLKIYIGPMFSSKSSSLLKEINRYKYITDRILVINNKLDKKRMDLDNLNVIETHNKNTYPAIMLEKMNDIYTTDYNYNKYLYADVVLIDEGQFFEDLYDFIKVELSKMYDRPKKYIIAGLSSDYNMNPIGDMIKLIPLADDVIKLSALCIYCKDGTLAHFTKYHGNYLNDTIKVGSDELYSPCCRLHYHSV